jgi:hypothetical protein
MDREFRFDVTESCQLVLHLPDRDKPLVLMLGRLGALGLAQQLMAALDAAEKREQVHVRN